MKKLNLEQMEVVQGGIMCDEIDGVLEYLGLNGHMGQYWSVVFYKLHDNIQCT